ncbi:maltose/moltooligosaccharide transporter [Mucilaginibacter gracilis]|uniref:Maltose/moltooligosaccharide transporter n=1 Tax=Mucilaginibacter gracilis TaxID=423350 RepID=A0A495IWR6_9SPHI|nr:MFS transporter [Mucilaginibacter gracilis]RKR80791.1 maltose/moltooligosaccharide transporter [Mucilaginibacter gracilis]
MSPIYSYLGAQESKLPYLWLAGPITGLLIQPIVGAFSDKTISKYGRRSPYFLVGAIICSLALFVMPHSSSVWMAASVLWILDAANNITQEPYRAFVSDKLDESQHPMGFLTQSAFTGLGQTLSYLTPTLLIFFGVSKMATNQNHIPVTTIIAFVIGSVMSISSILYSLSTTKEIPLTEAEKQKIRSAAKGFKATLIEITTAITQMPAVMKQMIPMMLFSWYAMFIYWIYIAKCLSSSVFGSVTGAVSGFREADLLSGQIGAFYNFIAFASAFGLAWLAKKHGAKIVHAACLTCAGAGLFALPFIHNPVLVFIPMVGMGLSWASMMGNPYIIIAGNIPPERTGIYMGIFNMFIVIPMLIQNVTMPMYYASWLGNNPQNAIKLAGVLLLLAALSVLFIKTKPIPSKA